MAKNWAIAIGINEYEHLPRPLQYAQRDAEKMRDWLQHRARFEKVYYFADNSPKIGNTSTRPTRSNLLRLLDVRFQQPFMGAGDNFWFFFSGHGVRHEGQDYLMAADSYPENIPGSAIPVSYVLGRLRCCGADNIVLLLDACRDGGKSVEGMGRETAQQAQQMGVISIASCSPHEISYEVEALEQGVFTYALLEGLGVQGRCATVERLDAYLARRVPELNKKYGKRIQTPLTTAEPIDRAHLILVPEYATQSDVATLKLDAYQAELDRNRALARQLWIRVNAVALGMDLDAIKAIERLASGVTLEPSPALHRQKSDQSKSQQSSGSSRGGTRTSLSAIVFTRQQVRQWMQWGLGGFILLTLLATVIEKTTLLEFQKESGSANRIPLPDPTEVQPRAAPPVAAPPAESSDPFREAVDKANMAVSMIQTARTPADWSQIAAYWQESVTSMQAVPESHPQYAIAQDRIPKYRRYLEYARQQTQYRKLQSFYWIV